MYGAQMLKHTRSILIALAIAVILVVPNTRAKADDAKAREIMEKVDARDDGDNGESSMEMILIDKNGYERKRSIKSFTKDKGQDTQRVMFFLSPADVKDTGFLTYDYDDPEKDDDQWMYLPALRKTKRIASSDKTASFMGSDFSYADMTSREIENYNYKLLKEMDVRGHKTWVIESVPKTQEIIDRYGYTKSLILVRQDNYVVVRGVHWLKEGGKMKYMDALKVDKVDGIWTVLEMTMDTRKNKQILHKTIMRFNEVKFNQKLDDNLFSIRRIEKGL